METDAPSASVTCVLSNKAVLHESIIGVAGLLIQVQARLRSRIPQVSHQAQDLQQMVSREAIDDIALMLPG